jgi:hypothetical protein
MHNFPYDGVYEPILLLDMNTENEDHGGKKTIFEERMSTSEVQNRTATGVFIELLRKMEEESYFNK